MGAWLLAFAIALAHGLLAVFLVVGAPFIARRRWVMTWYLILLVPTAVVNLARMPCPLTVWEKHFWRLADQTPYEGGFISRYFVEPFHAPGLGPAAETGLLVFMVIWSLSWLLYAVVCHLRRPRGSSDTQSVPAAG